MKPIFLPVKARYIAKVGSLIYGSLSHFAQTYNIPIGTITKAVHRKMRGAIEITLTFSGITVHIEKV